MSEDVVQLPPDSTGKKIRAIKKTVGANEVYMEGSVPYDEDGVGLFAEGGAGWDALPQTTRVIRFDGDYVNLWGFGDNIYLALHLEETHPDSTPIFYRMSPGGALETLLTRGGVNTICGYAVGEIVAVLEATDGTVFCTSHSDPVHILRKRPSDDAFTSVYNDATMRTSYGMAIDDVGNIFATMRGAADIGGPHRSIIKSTDMGTTWATVWSDETTDWLFGIEAYGSYVVAGGEYIIVRSTNRGVDWATTVITKRPRATKCFGGVPLNTTKWAAFPAGAAYLISLDGGVTWTEPVNTLPVALGSTPNPVSIRPNGEVYVLCGTGIQFARSRNLSKWDPSGLIYSGAQSRGIYVTDTHIYISSSVSQTSAYYGQPDNGMVWIIPISTLEWAESKETYLMHDALDCTVDDTDYNSSSLIVLTAKKLLLEYTITETGTLVADDRLIINVEFSDDLTTWYPYQDGSFGYLAEAESTTPCNKCVGGDCFGEYMRITVTTDYTNADPSTNYFTITVKITLLEN